MNNFHDAHGGTFFINLYSVLKTSLQSIAQRRFSRQEVLKQLYEFGVSSVAITTLCVSFIGMIIILEYSFHMKLVIGNDSLIPSFAMLMLVRELAPVVTGLLLTSKMGAAIAAELGAMKTTEQLDAYRLLAISPIDFFVAPRLIASTLTTLALAILSLFLAILGSWIAALAFLGFSTGSFFQSLFAFAHFSDFILCGVKALVFGASIPIISATYGFRCEFGSEGVGRITTDAVVANSIWIIIADFLLTYLFSLGT